MDNLIKALSLECLPRETLEDTQRNQDLFKELDSLDESYKSCSCKAERIPILARVYEICLIMDVI